MAQRKYEEKGRRHKVHHSRRTTEPSNDIFFLVILNTYKSHSKTPEEMSNHGPGQAILFSLGWERGKNLRFVCQKTVLPGVGQRNSTSIERDGVEGNIGDAWKTKATQTRIVKGCCFPTYHNHSSFPMRQHAPFEDSGTRILKLSPPSLERGSMKRSVVYSPIFGLAEFRIA
jgi:hypothetical protein